MFDLGILEMTRYGGANAYILSLRKPRTWRIAEREHTRALWRLRMPLWCQPEKWQTHKERATGALRSLVAKLVADAREERRWQRGRRLQAALRLK